MPERFRGELLTMGCYTNPASFSLYGVCVSVCFITGVMGLLTLKPENINAYIGDNVMMYCNTSVSEAVDWQRKHFEIFCFGGLIKAGYEDKFSISNPQDGFYVVTVKNVQRNDSGEYRCIEGVDNPSYGIAVLTVNGNNFICLIYLPLPGSLCILCLTLSVCPSVCEQCWVIKRYRY